MYRGVFDGDGSIYGTKNNKWELNIASNKFFLESIKDIFTQNNIKSNIHKHYKLNVWYLRVSGRLNCIDVYNYLYNQANIYLTRKYVKFIECINSTTSIRHGNSWKKEKRINN